jgi:hypothetical protein
MRFPGPTLATALAAAAALTAAPAAAQSPDWTVVLSVRPQPSPYIADWENDPSIVTLVLSYTGTTSVAFHLVGTMRLGPDPVLGGTSTPFEFVRPSQLVLTAGDGIWERNSVTYEPSFSDQLQRTGRLSDGEYQFCVDVREGLPESGGGALLGRDCAPFSITAPQPPSLIAPNDLDTVVQTLPAFTWTPVVAGYNLRVTYHLRLAELLPGQAPIEALNNVPVLEQDLETTTLQYPPDGLPLEDSARYVWQVQALDDAGQPVGERQGKSEAWTFTHLSNLPGIIALVDSVPPEEEVVVSRFDWAGVEIKVLSLRDSSPQNYSGRARATIIPGVFEPAFSFRSVRLTADGRRVDAAPRHRLKVPSTNSLFEGAQLLNLGAAIPVVLQLTGLDLVADSASGERHVGLTGEIVIKLPYSAEDSAIAARQASATAEAQARVDSLQAAYDSTTEAFTVEWDACVNQAKAAEEAGTQDFSAAMSVYCADVEMPSDEELKKARGAANAQPTPWYLDANWRAQYEKHFLAFRFVDLRVGPNGPAGALWLARTWSSQDIGMTGFRMTLYGGETGLTIAGGVGTLDLKGDFRIPAWTGLVPEPGKLDSTATQADSARQATADSAIVLRIQRARVSTAGEIYLDLGGIPLARLGATGLKLRTGNLVADLSGELSPAGRPAGWRGVYIDSARVFLPLEWNTYGDAAWIAQDTGQASVAGRALLIDERGFSGDVSASGLEQLGPIGYGGFSGRLDSLRFKFTAGALDTGYVEGKLAIPFLESPISYAVSFTPIGVDRLYAKLDDQEPIAMPALGATLLIQRGELVYDRPVGTFTMDAKLSIDREGVGVRGAQVYGLSISNDGGLKLKSGWLAFDGANQATLSGFPVALDSIGFGSGTTGDEVWLGLAGRVALADNLPASAGTFRVFAVRDAPGAAWRFDRVLVDKLDLAYQNGAVAFRGALDYMRNDSIYGSGFRAAVRMSVQDQFSVEGNFIAGATSFRYWYLDAKLLLPPPGIQLGSLPLSLYGFGGGAYARMRASIDTLTLKATYVPDSTTAFGLKAIVTLGTSAQQGFIWNADAMLEATVGTSGGLQSLTLRGDNWMLTDVTQRLQRVWGTVLVNLPVSQPVLHASATVNVNLRPALTGSGWYELHYDPSTWYLHAGTPARPHTLTLLPGGLNLPSTAYFMMDEDGVAAGFSTVLRQEKTVGWFYGRVDAGFEANAEMRYRPFMAAGEGELWGNMVAKVKGYEIFRGDARATMSFRFPDPTRVWGKVRLKYRLLSGTLRGTYKMRYSWGGSGDEAGSDTSQFVLVAETYPRDADTLAPLTGVSYYLGMSEGAEYGVDDGVYRLRLAGTPTISKETLTTPTLRDPRTGRVIPRAAVVTWVSLGVAERDFDAERQTLTLKAPGFAALEPGQRYRAVAPFVLEKYTGGAWVAQQNAAGVVTFRTFNQPLTVGQLVERTDPPGGGTPVYYGGPNAGTVRARVSNVHPDLTSGAVVGRLIASGTDTVPGTWGTSAYQFALFERKTSDPTLYAFRPAAGALAPSTSYRFAIVQNDSTRREHYGITFQTSRYASLAEHVSTSLQTITPDRGVGPTSGTGNYLLGARILLAGPEPIAWEDIDSIDVSGLANWGVTPRTRCQWLGGTSPAVALLGVGLGKLCGATPTYENILDVAFTAADDAQLPPANTTAITLRLNHRREGWQTFTFTFPALAPPPTITTTAVQVDVTRVKLRR